MKKNFLFLGFAIPEEEMKNILNSDHFPAIQTHKFNWNLIKGLEVHKHFMFTYISSRPISDYPYFPEKYIKSRRWTESILDNKIEITEIPFINTGILKILTRFLSGIYFSFKKYHEEKNKGGVIVYSVNIPYMLIGYIISKVYNIDYIGIWTDPPSVRNNRESYIKSKLRNIELFISKHLMNRTTKVITLTKYLAEDFAPKKPYLVIEGIIDENDIMLDKNKNQKENLDVVKIVYTGSLEKRYGIKNIVEGFKLLKDKNTLLEIYGRGDYEEELKELCLTNNRVNYKGFVSNKVILDVQSEADFLINARSSEEEYVKYSFPSKTLEYMLSGTPLITTMLPGMPLEYEDYVLVLKNNNPQVICEMLESSIKMDKEERNKVGLKALDFVKRKNYFNQGKKIVNFLT